jgi:hypothetical protein
MQLICPEALHNLELIIFIVFPGLYTYPLKFPDYYGIFIPSHFLIKMKLTATWPKIIIINFT